MTELSIALAESRAYFSVSFSASLTVRDGRKEPPMWMWGQNMA